MSDELMTLDQAEDAAATALANLFLEELAGSLGRSAAELGADMALDGPCLPRDFVPVFRELLRGPLAEDYSRRPGGYCMKAPADSTLRALGHLGARLVEISYQVRNVPRALDEADALLEEFRRVART